MAQQATATRSGRLSKPVTRSLSSSASLSSTAAIVPVKAEPAPTEAPPPKKKGSAVAARKAPPRKRPKLEEQDDDAAPSRQPSKQPRKAKAPLKKEEPDEDVLTIKDEAEEEEDVKPRTAAGRKKRNAAASSPETFPPRVKGSTHHVGAHISSAGGVENAPLNALRIGANAFSLFVRPKMQWASKPLSEANLSTFPARRAEHGYDGVQHVVPHGCYLVNLANPDKEKRDKSFEAFLDDLTRCEALGIQLYNFHPGSTVGECEKEQGCAYIAEAIDRAHALTKNVTILIENMAGAGNLVGGRFEELRSIIAGVKDKTRVGICLDTCHAFAAGYDLRTRATYDATMATLGEVVGFEYVKAVHLNDSKTPLGSHRDRHENIGAGHLGLFPFYALMNDERFAGIPLILETPGGSEESDMRNVWKREVAALYSLQGKSEDPSTWTEASTLLAEVGEIRIRSESHKASKKEKLKPNRRKAQQVPVPGESSSD